MASRHPHKTTGRQARPTPRPPPRRPRWTRRQRSPPKTAADPHAAPPKGDPANASAPAPPEQTDTASKLPSQLLNVEVLRGPLESTHVKPVTVGVSAARWRAEASAAPDGGETIPAEAPRPLPS